MQTGFEIALALFIVLVEGEPREFLTGALDPLALLRLPDLAEVLLHISVVLDELRLRGLSILVVVPHEPLGLLAPMLLVHRLRVVFNHVVIVILLHRVLVVRRLRGLDHFLSLLVVHVHYVVMVQISLWLPVAGRKRLFHAGVVAELDAVPLGYTYLEALHLLSVWVAVGPVLLLLKIHHCQRHLISIHAGAIGGGNGRRSALHARGGPLL